MSGYSDVRVITLIETAENSNARLEARLEAVRSLGNLSVSGMREASEALGRIANSECREEVVKEAARQLGRTN